jgi:hypothetical protein
MLGRRKLREACVVVLSVTQFEDHHSDEKEQQPLECELQGDDLDGGKGYIRRMVRVQGLPRGWAKKNGIESSVTTIFAKGSDIDYDTDELIIPANVEVVVGHLDTHVLPKTRHYGLTLTHFYFAAWSSWKQGW